MKFNLRYASDSVRKKLELYELASDLFNQGKSFPQILEIVIQHEQNTELVNYILTKAMHDAWKGAYEKSKQMLDDGIPLVDIKKKLTEEDGDKEIVDFFCEYWYRLKLSEANLSGISSDLVGKSLKQIAYGGILFVLVYQLSTKWYILIFPSLFILLGVYGIIMSVFTKWISKIIHKINNE
jgi:hypothetical protein